MPLPCNLTVPEFVRLAELDGWTFSADPDLPIATPPRDYARGPAVSGAIAIAAVLSSAEIRAYLVSREGEARRRRNEEQAERRRAKKKRRAEVRKQRR